MHFTTSVYKMQKTQELNHCAIDFTVPESCLIKKMVASNIMSSIAYVLTFLCITTVISASRQPAPAPEANSPIPAPAVSAIPSPNPEDRPPIASPVPSADSPETNFPPSIAGVFDVTEHGAEPDGGTESSSVCFFFLHLPSEICFFSLPFIQYSVLFFVGIHSSMESCMFS